MGIKRADYVVVEFTQDKVTSCKAGLEVNNCMEALLNKFSRAIIMPKLTEECLLELSNKYIITSNCFYEDSKGNRALVLQEKYTENQLVLFVKGLQLKLVVGSINRKKNPERTALAMREYLDECRPMVYTTGRSVYGSRNFG